MLCGVREGLGSVMRCTKGESYEVLNLLGLGMRVGTTAASSPASLVRTSVTMLGIEQLQLVPSPSGCASSSNRAYRKIPARSFPLHFQCRYIDDMKGLV